MSFTLSSIVKETCIWIMLIHEKVPAPPLVRLEREREREREIFLLAIIQLLQIKYHICIWFTLDYKYKVNEKLDTLF